MRYLDLCFMTKWENLRRYFGHSFLTKTFETFHFKSISWHSKLQAHITYCDRNMLLRISSPQRKTILPCNARNSIYSFSFHLENLEETAKDFSKTKITMNWSKTDKSPDIRGPGNKYISTAILFSFMPCQQRARLDFWLYWLYLHMVLFHQLTI